MRAYSEGVSITSDHPRHTSSKDIIKSDLKTLKKLNRKLQFCWIKIDYNIHKLRHFLALENCESNYHDLQKVLRNINREIPLVLSTVGVIYIQIKNRKYEDVPLQAKLLSKRAQSLKSIEADIQKSIDDLLSFGRGLRSGGI